MLTAKFWQLLEIKLYAGLFCRMLWIVMRADIVTSDSNGEATKARTILTGFAQCLIVESSLADFECMPLVPVQFLIDVDDVKIAILRAR